MRELLIIERIMKGRRAGPKPSFSKYDLLKTLWLIYNLGPTGRKMLAESLHLGEGSVRTIIKYLRQASLVKESGSGCELTGKGRVVAEGIWRLLVKQIRLPKDTLVNGEYVYGILIRGSASKVRNGLEQRDAAVKVGANGATTIVCRGGRLIIPPETEPPPEDWGRMAEMIYRKFEPQDCDVIIISGADNEAVAERAALAGSWTLLMDRQYRNI
ncbi:MAG: DUF4443 domain-containing protein [Candidatus Bathyarchaeia archaeon]